MGQLENQEPRTSLCVTLPVAGKVRICEFRYAQNPMRAAVLVGRVPEDPEDIDAFSALLHELDPQSEYAHEVVMNDEVILWLFNLPTTDRKTLDWWFRFAQRRVATIDMILATAQGGRTEEGKYQFPALSLARN
jgi:hypothetical protein